MLHDLSRGVPVEYRRYEFGQELMDGLVDEGFFVADLPPSPPQMIMLTIDGERSKFCLFQIRDWFDCEEDEESGTRKFTFDTLDDLRVYRLDRQKFYKRMASELKINGDVRQVACGIWHLGKRSVPGQGRAAVFFIERGVGDSVITECVVRNGINLNCFMGAGPVNQVADLAGKECVWGQLTVQSGCFSTEVFEDAAVHRPEQHPETCIDLDCTPPKLVVRGKKLDLPVNGNQPSKGARYWAYLFDHPRTVLTCWELEQDVVPELAQLAANAGGADRIRDQRYTSDVAKKIEDLRNEIAEATREGASELEINELVDQLTTLQQQQKADSSLHGKSRLLGGGDLERCRRRVRKAIQSVCVHVARQDSRIGKTMKESTGEGMRIYFNPPPDWEL